MKHLVTTGLALYLPELPAGGYLEEQCGKSLDPSHSMSMIVGYH